MDLEFLRSLAASIDCSACQVLLPGGRNGHSRGGRNLCYGQHLSHHCIVYRGHSTVYHCFHGIYIIFPEIDPASLTFAKVVRAGSVEEATPCAYDGSVTEPTLVVADNRQIRIP